MKVEVKNLSNEVVRQLELPDDVFGYPYKEHLIHVVIEGYRAGLRSGDVVLAINGKPTDDAATLRNQISAMPPGTRAPLKVSRAGGEVLLEIEVAKRPKQFARAPDDGTGTP